MTLPRGLQNNGDLPRGPFSPRPCLSRQGSRAGPGHGAKESPGAWQEPELCLGRVPSLEMASGERGGQNTLKAIAWPWDTWPCLCTGFLAGKVS